MARVVRFLSPKQCLHVNLSGGVGQGDWCTLLSSTAQFFAQQKGRRSHQRNGEPKKMLNDSAMNDTYSRRAAVHSFPPSPGRGTRNGVPVRPQQLSSAVCCLLLSQEGQQGLRPR